MADAYITGLRMLARRELSEAQVRQRLTRKEFQPDEIDAAVERLQSDRSLDDRRTALACARTEALVNRRGRLRVLRQVEALGIDRDIARTAVAEAFADVDEDAALENAIDRRLRGVDTSPPAAAALRRVQQYLLRQGFDAGKVHSAIRKRSRPTDYNRSA